MYCRSSAQGSRLLHSDAAARHSSTVSHLENQLACCVSLRSAKEYHFWLLAYVRYLVQEGNLHLYLTTCFFVIIVVLIVVIIDCLSVEGGSPTNMIHRYVLSLHSLSVDWQCEVCTPGQPATDSHLKSAHALSGLVVHDCMLLAS